MKELSEKGAAREKKKNPPGRSAKEISEIDAEVTPLNVDYLWMTVTSLII